MNKPFNQNHFMQQFKQPPIFDPSNSHLSQQIMQTTLPNIKQNLPLSEKNQNSLKVT